MRRHSKKFESRHGIFHRDSRVFHRHPRDRSGDYDRLDSFTFEAALKAPLSKPVSLDMGNEGRAA
jgi:hypothetical protein